MATKRGRDGERLDADTELPATASSVLGLIRDDGPADLEGLHEGPPGEAEGVRLLREASVEADGSPSAAPASPPEAAAARASQGERPRRLGVALLWVLVVCLAAALVVETLWTMDGLRRLDAEVHALRRQVDGGAGAVQLASLRARLDRMEGLVREQGRRMDALDAAVVPQRRWEALRSELEELRRRLPDPADDTQEGGGPAQAAGGTRADHTGAETHETAAASGAPASRENWAVNLITVAGEGRARAYRERYAAQGLDVRMEAFEKGGRKLYRLFVDGYPDRETALREGRRLKERLRLDELWVTRVE